METENTKMAATSFVCHKNFLLFNLDAARYEEAFCDITLIAKDNVRIAAHRVVLMASSNYFKSMFMSGMKETQEHEVSMKQFDGNTLKAIVTFLYTGEIELNFENMELLLQAAGYLQLNHLNNTMAKFIESDIKESNWACFLDLFDRYKYFDLVDKIQRYIGKNIHKIRNTEDFLNLSCHHIKRFLQSEHLNVESEADLFFCLKKWIDYDKKQRQLHLPTLLPLIRLSQTNDDFILQHVEPLCNSYELTQIITSALKWLRLDVSDRNTTNNLPSNWMKKRQCEEHLLVVLDLTVEIYCFEERKWKKLADIPDGHGNSNAVMLNGYLFLIGGSSTKTKCDRFEIKTKQWMQTAILNEYHRYPVLTSFNNQIYAVGGYDYYDDHSSAIERYSLITNEWTPLNNIPTGRHSMEIIPADQCLYCIGGHSQKSPVTDVIYYEKNTWISGRPLITARHNFGIVFDNSEFFIIGGGTDNVERRSLNGVTSCQVVEGSSAVKKCVLFQNKLIAFGEDVVFECDGDRNTWRPSDSIMPLTGNMFRGAFSVNSQFFSETEMLSIKSSSFE